jgi:hypothetical protein
MAITYEPIATTTLGSAQSSVTFSSLGSYTDIILISSAWTGSADIDIFMQFNSDTASNYSVTRLYGTGSAAASNRQTSQTGIKIAGSNNTTPNANITHIMNYGNATTYKTVLSRSDISDLNTNAYVGLWRSTSTITSIKVYPQTGNFSTGSSFTIFGVKAA